MTSARGATVLAFALGLSIVPTALLASEPAAPEPWARRADGQQPDAPRYPVDVQAVALDVLVTDKEGRFVPGLKPSDFRVREQGVPQELSFFSPGRAFSGSLHKIFRIRGSRFWFELKAG